MSRVRFFGLKAQGAFALSGGNAANNDTLTIGDKIFEFQNDAHVTPGHVMVDCSVSAAATTTNLIAAILANPSATVPIQAYADPVSNVVTRLKGAQRGSAGNVALAKVCANGVLSGAAMTNGENGGTQTLHRGAYTVTALDVTATSVVIETGLTGTPRFASAIIQDSTGKILENVTDTLVVVAGLIKFPQAGATHLAATNVVVWEAWA